MTTNTTIKTELDNKLIENMFLACAGDEQIETFYRLLDMPVRGHGLATSYASKKVAKEFSWMLHKRTGLDYASILG